jgi:twitching motility protein PilT
MRDAETMKIALAAGETGHLVLSTLHTTDVPSTIARMTDSFPAERQPTIRQEIAAALVAVLVQTLIPMPGGGRVPAAELLMVSYGARNHIRRNALQHLQQEITLTRKLGSYPLEESLARLVHAGRIDPREAAQRSNHADDLKQYLASGPPRGSAG